jgi:hypothetical protein
VVSANAASVRAVYAEDVDLDGDIDVVSASFDDDKIAWHENDGNENFTERVISTGLTQNTKLYTICRGERLFANA